MVANVEDYIGKVMLADGAWGTELDRLGCPPGYCREEWNVSKPELVERVAASYVTAGSEIILTNTFGGNRIVLAGHGCEGRTREFNEAGAAISKRAAGHKAKVFGSMGPSGKMLLIGEVDEKTLYDVFKEQAEALAAGGADGLVVETMADLTEAMTAVRAAKTTGLPVVGSMTFDSGRDKSCTLMGVTPEQAVQGLTQAGADIIGCNCGIGIENYIKVAARLRAATTRPIWVKANAGLPEIDGSRVVYRMSPKEFAQKARQVIEAGANIIGGCCGTTPEFIAVLAAAVR
ncbi:MAG: homocysteine S-methyltransferase family protein [Phycisphaerae bacterium]